MRHTGNPMRRLVLGRAVRPVMLLCLLLSSCSTVPLTGRTQLSLIPESTVMKMSLTEYEQVISKAKLSQNREQSAMVKRVGERIARAAEDFLRENGLEQEVSNYHWEFNLIDDPDTVNAWCMPGGKIAVYTGILPVTRDENGLAVVMGHEVAHALAQHGRERLSQGLLVQMGGVALAVALSQKPEGTRNLFMAAYGLGATVGLILPYSRQHEYEADRIGLTIMAKAGYDPHAAIGLWERMRDLSKEKERVDFLSTHPAPQSRIDYIKEYIPEAMKQFRASRQDGRRSARRR